MLFALALMFTAPAQAAAGPSAGVPAAVAPHNSGTPDAGEPPRVYVMDLTSDALAPETVRGLSSLIAQNMRPDAFNVLTAGDVASVLDLEAEKAALGCEAKSCAAEVASALGTTAVVYGDIVPAGEQYVVNLAFYDAEAARVVGRSSVTASSDAAVLRSAPRLAYDLTAPLLKARGFELGPRPEFADDGIATPESLFGMLGYSGLAIAAGGAAGTASGLLGALGVYAFASGQLIGAESRDDRENAAAIQKFWFESRFVSIAVYAGTAVAALGVFALLVGGGLVVYDGVVE